MDTKSKNNRYVALALLGFVLVTTILALTVANLYDNRRYLDKDFFVSRYSNQIIEELATVAQLIKEAHVDYADYSAKSAQQKLDEDVLAALNQDRDHLLTQLDAELDAEYNTRIEEARTAGNLSQISLLQAEKENKRFTRQRQLTADYEARVKESVSARDQSYENVKFNLLLRDGTFKYAIQDKKNNKVYTNLDHQPTDTELRQSALISIKIPQSRGERNWGLNRFFQENQWEGIIYIPQVTDPYEPALSYQFESKQVDTGGYYNQIISDATYYQSIRNRLIKEIMLLVVFLLVDAGLFWYLRQNKGLEHPFVTKFLAIFRRIPLDLRILSVLPAGLFYLVYAFDSYFFSFPIGFDQFFTLVVMSPFTAYFLLFVIEAWNMYKQPEFFASQWRNSLSIKILSLLRDSFADRGMFFKLLIIFVLTVGFCISAGSGLIFFFRRDLYPFLIAFFYCVFYVLFVLPYILRRTALLNRITRGVEQMSAGNFDVVIDAGKTKGKLAKTAHSLNNLQHGVKRSLESQMKSERLKSELITNVSHDLKTPLTSIINYVDLLKREDLPLETRNEYVQILERKTDRLKALIDDLFEAAKMSSGSVELNIEQVNVAALVKQALAEFSDKIEQSSLTFRTNIEDGKINAPLDGKKTWRVFENLIGNALKYSLPNTRVYVDLTETADKVRFTIKNVSAYEINFDAEELFERFKRADESRNTEGSGLGLAIAKSIVELQGGKLFIEIDGDYFKVIVEFIRYR